MAARRTFLYLLRPRDFDGRAHGSFENVDWNKRGRGGRGCQSDASMCYRQDRSKGTRLTRVVVLSVEILLLDGNLHVGRVLVGALSGRDDSKIGRDFVLSFRSPTLRASQKKGGSVRVEREERKKKRDKRHRAEREEEEKERSAREKREWERQRGGTNRVAEGVDVHDRDVRRSDEHVLEEAGDHVPGVVVLE